MAHSIIKKRKLYREEIEDILKQAILTNQLKPGDRVVETRWARELGVSQSPVREAIRELEVVGLIENIPYRGAFVKCSHTKDLRDAYLVRNTLEQVGIREIVGKIPESRLKEMRICLDAMEKAASSDDMQEYIQQNVLFHQLYMNESDNAMLLRLWNQCNIREWTQLGTSTSGEPLTKLSLRHEAIYNALAAHDLSAALKACDEHFESLIRGLDEHTAAATDAGHKTEKTHRASNA